MEDVEFFNEALKRVQEKEYFKAKLSQSSLNDAIKSLRCIINVARWQLQERKREKGLFIFQIIFLLQVLLLYLLIFPILHPFQITV